MHSDDVVALPAIDRATAERLLAAAYRVTLGRLPDEGGARGYLPAIERGDLCLMELLNHLERSWEFAVIATRRYVAEAGLSAHVDETAVRAIATMIRGVQANAASPDYGVVSISPAALAALDSHFAEIILAVTVNGLI